jgi:hypothetical protein
MTQGRLDEHILEKLVEKSGKSTKYIREQISKRASRRGVSSETVLVLWAKEFGVGTARYQQSLPPYINQEIRDQLPRFFAPREPTVKQREPTKKRNAVNRKVGMLSAAVEYLLEDNELRSRCSDLLRAKGNFDRVFREATTVLDDRLKKLSGIRANPSELAARVLHPRSAILRVSQDQDEQEGFFLIVKGLFQTFRNPVHHELSDKFTVQDALRFCGFVDSLLAVLAKANRTLNP